MNNAQANPITFKNGSASWTEKPGDSYAVTGRDVRGKPFTIKTTSCPHAQGINLFRGKRFLVRNGRRYLINEVFN